MSKRQKIIVIIAIIAAITALLSAGWYVWTTQLKSADVVDSQSQTASQADKTEYKNLTVNGYTFKYPLNSNNAQVLLEDSGNVSSPFVAYAPVRSYFVGNSNKDCQAATAGLLQADRLDKLFGPSNPYGFAETVAQKQAKADGLVKGGRAVKLGDIYVLAPSKQNEPCAELTDPKDGKLQIALFEAQEIQRQWLKSLEIVH
jgi:hypothetical protein